MAKNQSIIITVKSWM